MRLIHKSGRTYLKVPVKPYTKAEIRKFASLKKEPKFNLFRMTPSMVSYYQKTKEMRK